ncbi:chromate efflux transporter [Candidatus Viridilinea mediisalina]|uniref:Chromate transporter n=1 Tax=Candidatus Viridilinea mediisalina TaxID=2024553 RepID=A0A2A6RMZ4_9CHLR|nr:chromate efflux transporter [Candidatus Viridilinea mediisalina]PDW04295.1 chromate transporter [Candidatus Viridilinea mediisalina]
MMSEQPAPQGTPLEVLAVFTRLGFTSFGGPVAHVGYFREELVERRRWLDEANFADLVALCQFLPGPASSQIGIALGTARAGLLGGFMAWIGFTMPSALLMLSFALGLMALGGDGTAGWLQGFKVVAVAVVTQALWGMAKNLTPDALRGTLAISAAVLLLLWPAAWMQIVVLLLGGFAGWLWLKDGPQATQASTLAIHVPAPLSWASGLLLLLGLGALPLLVAVSNNHGLALFDAFFRAGSLVFGGGHVVLPLLEQYVVAPGWVIRPEFIAGYGAAQAMPGPMLSFAAYLGAMSGPAPNGLLGASIALLGIFLPSFLLIWASLPLWARLRSAPSAQAVLRGINAAVVGILLAALYDPVMTSAIHSTFDVALALSAFAALHLWRVPAWALVLVAAAGGLLFG